MNIINQSKRPLWFLCCLVISIIKHVFSSDLSCGMPSNCSNTTLACNETEPCSISCYEKRSCENSIVICPSNNNCSISCSSTESCYGMNVILQSQTSVQLDCSESKSCRYSSISVNETNITDFNYLNDIYVNCSGELSCANSDFIFPTMANTTTIFACAGLESCKSSTIDARYSFSLDFISSAELAAENLKLLRYFALLNFFFLFIWLSFFWFVCLFV